MATLSSDRGISSAKDEVRRTGMNSCFSLWHPASLQSHHRLLCIGCLGASISLSLLPLSAYAQNWTYESGPSGTPPMAYHTPYDPYANWNSYWWSQIPPV